MAIGHKGRALQTYWTIAQTGTPCEISTDGRCVTDGAGNYESNEQCTMTAQVQSSSGLEKSEIWRVRTVSVTFS